MNKPIAKKVMPSTDVFVQFTEDEMAELDMKPGDKYSIEKNGCGGLTLRKFATIQLEMADFSRESLEMLVAKSCEEDKSCNDVISDVLTEMVERYEAGDPFFRKEEVSDSDGPCYDEPEEKREGALSISDKVALVMDTERHLHRELGMLPTSEEISADLAENGFDLSEEFVMRARNLRCHG